MVDGKDLNRLKVILAEKKKSNLWLSKQLGCAPTTVSKWCTNTAQPPLEQLMKIAKSASIATEILGRRTKSLKARRAILSLSCGHSKNETN